MSDPKILLDVPADQPGLGFNDYATALAGLIESSDPRFAIGIFGGWGSGKTTLMNAIEKQLRSPHVISVKFSAWRYEKEDHLIVPLLDTLRLELENWGTTNAIEIAKTTAATIGKVVYSLLAGFSMKLGVPKALELSLDADKALKAAKEVAADPPENVASSFYHTCFQSLTEAFQEFVKDDPRRRIVVFVDDLDRCLPKGALEVLESMKLFFDLRGFVFVLGLDRDVVEAAIEAKYAEQARKQERESTFRVSGAEYIKKLFQVPFSLFPVANAEIDGFLTATYAAADLDTDQVNELTTLVRPHVDYLVTESGINPREIKRYINAYTIKNMVKPGLNQGALLTLQTVEFRSDWSLVYESLFAYRSTFLDSLRAEVGGDTGALAKLDPRLTAIPRDFNQYVAKGTPGHALLEVSTIDEYLYAGEVTRSGSGSGYVADMVKEITELRPRIREIADASDPGEIEKFQRELMDIVAKRSESEERINPFFQAAFDNLRVIGDRLNQLKGSSTDRDQWVTLADELITQSVTSLVRGAR